MITVVVILAAALAGALAAVFVLWGKLSAARVENARLGERCAASDSALARQKADIEQINADFEKRFSQLATRVLALNSETLRQQNTHGLSEVLAPVKQDLENFKRSITEYYSQEARERFSLGERIRDLVDLNNTVSRETRRLTDALKGNSRLQGEWGEIILDNILEQAGFRRGYEYTVQETVTDADGNRLRPDVVINYTEGRKIIIDSKVSIQAYINMLNADSEAGREQYARAHIMSVKKHIAELRTKSYQDVVGDGRFDHVLMFIPHEGAFLAAMNLDPKLWQTAYDSHVLIISPTHLMSIVKLIEQMWRHDKQNRNALAIADEAGKMLDKLRGFLDDMDRLDKSISSARDAWNTAFGKLTGGPGTLIARAQKLEQLGAKSKKNLPPRYTADDDNAS